jgi:hypothetical protein
MWRASTIYLELPATSEKNEGDISTRLGIWTPMDVSKNLKKKVCQRLADQTSSL